MTIHPLAPRHPRLTLGFLTPHNPHDSQAFSGTVHFALRALQNRPDMSLRLLGGHRPPRRLDRLLRRAPPGVDVAALDMRGIDLVVGRCPTHHRRHPAVRHMGFLDKNRPRQAARLARLYSEAHLLVLPTRADCTPMVVSEAMAHGTPVIATDIGGVAGQIGGAGAGRLMTPRTASADWAGAMAGMTSGGDHYAALSDASFERARDVLSWEAWAGGIERLARRSLHRTTPELRIAAGG